MKSEDLYELYTVYRMSMADKDINSKLEILKLEQGVSISRFITEAIYAKLKRAGCTFSDHGPTIHTRLKTERKPSKKNKGPTNKSGRSGVDGLRDSLFSIDFEAGQNAVYHSKVKKEIPEAAESMVSRGKAGGSGLEELRNKLFRIQYGVHEKKK